MTFLSLPHTGYNETRHLEAANSLLFFVSCLWRNMSNDKKHSDKASEYKTSIAMILLLALFWMLTGCSGTAATVRAKPYQAGERLFTHLESGKADDRFMEELYASRTWGPSGELTIDPIELGKNAKIPIQNEKIKLLGPAQEDALRSLALKIWMIEHAEHTVDVVYYIFKTDLAGEAVLGALCNAVQRGVDVRFMVDSIGSISLANRKMMALESCAQNAGYLRDENGRPTKYKARVQTVIFNSLTNTLGWINRRSHDKLLVIDGAFPEKTTVITGGRNISLDYYGIREDGSVDPTAYRDLEIVLRHGPGTGASRLTVGNIRCQPWRAKRRLVDPSSREAALFSRRALRQRENKVGLRTRRPVIWESSTEQQRACEVVA